MTKLFIRTARWLALAAAVLAALTLGATAVFADEIPQIYDTKDMPPFTAVEYQNADGVFVTGNDIGIYKATGKQYYLFLPGTADLRMVTLRYDGTMTAYDDRTGTTVKPGETFVADLSGGSVSLFEYDEVYGVYDRYTLTVMQGGTLPVIYINLRNGEKSLVEINSRQSNVESGTIRMVGTDGLLTYEGDLTRIKGHGLTSYDRSGRSNTKNSYNINIGDKAELVPGAGRSKKWSLLRIRTWGEYDATGLSYVTAFATYNALVKDAYFNLSARFVDVYINGEYRGVYVLTERMDINGSMTVTDLESKTDMPSSKTKQVQRKKSDPAIAKGIQSYSYAQDSSVPEGTDITGGYILEIMCGHYGECGFKTREGMYVNIKSPAYPTQEMVQYIAGYVQDFENALFSETGYNDEGKHWTEYADVKSYAAQTLIYTFYLNWEIYRTSTYMTKDANSVIKFGPVWDFESGPSVMYDSTIFGVRFGYSEKQQYIWFQQAWKKGDYLRMVAEINDEMRGILDQMFDYKQPEDGRRVIWSLSDMADVVKDSHQMNWIRWSQPNTYDDWYGAMRTALEYRYDHWFNTLWNPNRYLLGLTASCEDNGDGTWTLTADPYGKLESDYAVWYKIEDDITKGVQFDTGDTVVVPAGGTYYCTITGPNNAFSQGASGKIFASKNLTVASNLISSPDSKPLEGTIVGSKQYERMLDQKSGLIDPAAASQASWTVKPAAEEPAAEDTEPADTSASVGRSVSDAEWILITAGIVLICAVMTAVTVTKKGGRPDEA